MLQFIYLNLLAESSEDLVVVNQLHQKASEHEANSPKKADFSKSLFQMSALIASMTGLSALINNTTTKTTAPSTEPNGNANQSTH